MIDQAVTQLLKNQPFLGYLLLNMRRTITKNIPTAGVNVTTQVNLFINPDFFNAMTLEQQVSVLEHECKHILHGHIDRAKKLMSDNSDYSKSDVFKLVNLAQDLAIDQTIRNVPKELKVSETFTFKHPTIEDFPDFNKHDTSEYYFQKLFDKAEKKKQNSEDGEMGNTLDDHSIWEQGSQDSEYVKDKISKTISRAKEQCEKANGAGSVSGDISLLIEKYLYKPKNWKSDLSFFVENTKNQLIESTRNRRHRRYGNVYPGNKIEYTLNLAAIIDTSGSMPNEILHQIWNELNAISKRGVKLTIIEADSNVQRTYQFNPKHKAEIKGRGGTLYNPAISKAKDLDVDGIIYFTDADPADVPENPGIPFLWALYNTNEKPFNFGRYTKVEITKIGD
jgi:predicted metal-dependent peptidase